MATLIYCHAHFQLDSSEEYISEVALLSSYQIATDVRFLGVFFYGCFLFLVLLKGMQKITVEKPDGGNLYWTFLRISLLG